MTSFWSFISFRSWRISSSLLETFTGFCTGFCSTFCTCLSVGFLLVTCVFCVGTGCVIADRLRGSGVGNSSRLFRFSFCFFSWWYVVYTMLFVTTLGWEHWRKSISRYSPLIIERSLSYSVRPATYSRPVNLYLLDRQDERLPGNFQGYI